VTGAALVFVSLALGSPPQAPGVEVQRPGDLAQWSLDWRAPPECPDRAQLVELVEGYAPGLEPPVGVQTRSRLRVVVDLSRAAPSRADQDRGALAGPWVARVEIAGPFSRQERSFSAPSCAELSRASALIAAVALEPVLVASELETSKPKPEPEPEPEPRLGPDVSGTGTTTASSEALFDPSVESALSANTVLPDYGERARSRRPRPRPRVGFGLAGGGGYGPIQAGWLSVGASVAVFAGLWRWELDGGWGAAPRLSGLSKDASAIPEDPEPTTSETARFRGWWLGTRGCVVPGVAAHGVEFPICPGFEIGEIRVNSIEPTVNPGTQGRLWGAASLGLGFNWQFVERAALTIDGTLLVPISRGDFVIDGEVAGTFAPVGVRGMIGFEIRI